MSSEQEKQETYRTNSQSQRVLDEDFFHSNRGVAEALQFLLLLGISLAVIFGLVIVGASQVTETGDQQTIRTAESELSKFQSDLFELSTGAPHRTTEVDLNGGTLGYGAPEETIIQLQATGPSGSTIQLESRIQPAIVSAGDASVVLDGGALIYQKDGGSSMSASPRFEIRESQSVLTIYETEQNGGSEQIAGGSSTTVDIVSYRASRTTEHLDPVVSGTDEKATVQITVESPRYRAWANYFEDHSHATLVNVDESNQRVEVEFETYEVLFQELETTLRYDRQ